jgi:hypothetical protein
MRARKFVSESGTESVHCMIDKNVVPKILKQVLTERGLWFENFQKVVKLSFLLA